MVTFFSDNYLFIFPECRSDTKILNNGVSEFDAFHDAYETWGNIIPVFHYSEGKNGTRAHSDMAINLPINYDRDVLFDVELKNKDYAILDILKRYNEREI